MKTHSALRHNSLNKTNMNATVAAFIDTTTPTLVLESFLEVEGKHPKLNLSGIGFLYKKYLDDSYLFITCGHFFWPEIFTIPEGSKTFITKDFGTMIEPVNDNFLKFEILEGPLFAKNENEDISFFKVRPGRENFEPFNLFEISDNLEDSADDGDVFLTMINDKGCIDLISQSDSKKLPFEKYNFKSAEAALSLKGSPTALTLITLGACEYPCYRIFSDVGASGSPIWTADKKLLGMNLGGMPGDWTAIISAQQIAAIITELGL